MSELEAALAAFRAEHKVSSKGRLAAMLVITRRAKTEGLPLDPTKLLTGGGGQVAGLSGGGAQKILREYGVEHSLGTEGGRTSRGSPGYVLAYATLLNDLKARGLADLDQVEAWWVERAKEFLASKPFRLRLDPSKSLRAVVRDVLAQATKRQADSSGTKYAGAVLQHLIGAKLELAIGGEKIEHHGFAVADAPRERYGDFALGDVAIHVTTMPTEALIAKCAENIEAGRRPIIVTIGKGVAGADALLTNRGIEARVDVFEAEQFIATNIYELSKFIGADRPTTVDQLVETYNRIVDESETDPSLRIEVARGRDG